MSSFRFFAIACLSVAAGGCATTHVETSGSVGRQQAVCEASGEHFSGLVLWWPQWRPDQKDVALREAAAQQGLEQFFAESQCFSKVKLLRPGIGDLAGGVSDQEALRLAQASPLIADKVIIIKVRELGPVVKLLASLRLVEGGTEVVLDTRVLDVRTGALIGDRQTHWKNGGAFVVKGVQTLDQDMRSALQAAFASGIVRE